MIKKSLALLAVSIVSSATFAAEGNTALANLGLSFSGSAAITSDYRFRGLTQTQSDPAIQGSFTLEHTSGLYFSAFASNVEFGSAAHLELDPQIGYATPLKLGSIEPTLDVGVVYYNYPSESDINWAEFYGKLTFDDVFTNGDSLLTNINYTSEYGGSNSDGWNVNLGYSFPFADSGFGGVAGLGYSKVDDFDFGDGSDDYIDWKVGVDYSVKSIDGLTAELAAVGTNIDGLSGAAKRGVETGAVFTLTKAF